MTIRLATIEDLDKLRKLNTQIFLCNANFDDDMIPGFAETEAGEKYFREALTGKDSCLFVAEEDGQLIGYTNGSLKDIPYRKSKYFEIENLGVLPKYQRQGIGAQLLETITEWAKNRGYQKIYIESYFDNIGAVSFYKKQGYKEIDISLEKVI